MHFTLLVSTFALLARPFAAAKNSLAYCATENTGSSYQAVSSIFQSNGRCGTNCANYAFGILQGKKCWCSNVAPAGSSQKNVSECATGCPGYPPDSCGSAAQGVWAYVENTGNDVTSTASGSASTSTAPTTSSGTASSSTAISSSTTGASQNTSSSDTTTTGSVVKETTAAGGEVKTITVSGASTTSGPDASAGSATHNTGSKLSGGSIAGIVIGVIGGIALVGALIFLVFFYRKRARAASPIPSPDMTDRTSQGSSFVRGVFPQGHVHDVSGSSTLGRQQTFRDNRMKPDIYPNGPRDSSVSLQDNEDYSRPVLRLTNPD